MIRLVGTLSWAYLYQMLGCVLIVLRTLLDFYYQTKGGYIMESFISVGIDVAADFSFVSIISPNYEQSGKPFKVTHLDLDSIERAIATIKKAEELFSMKSQIFLESTGIFHLPLFCYLQEAGFEVFVLNPLITHSNKNLDIRKVKNDKLDSVRIARLGLNPDIKKSVIPDAFVLNLRSLCREYFSLSDTRTAFINKLSNNIRVAFPALFTVFPSISAATPLALLEKISSLDDLITRPEDEIIDLIANTSRRSKQYAKIKYDSLIVAAHTSKKLSQPLPSMFTIIKSTVKLIREIDGQKSIIMDTIKSIASDNKEHPFIKQINIVDSIPGIGFFSAVALMCEIGDFSAFKNSKQLFAYFGIDPSVNESGKFKGTNNHMSKRGSKFARRVLFSAALASVRTNRNGEDINPVLKNFYLIKTQSKPKKVALGAVMHKICNIIFAVLSSDSQFVLITPEQHNEKFRAA